MRSSASGWPTSVALAGTGFGWAVCRHRRRQPSERKAKAKGTGKGKTKMKRFGRQRPQTAELQHVQQGAITTEEGRKGHKAQGKRLANQLNAANVVQVQNTLPPGPTLLNICMELSPKERSRGVEAPHFSSSVAGFFNSGGGGLSCSAGEAWALVARAHTHVQKGLDLGWGARGSSFHLTVPWLPWWFPAVPVDMSIKRSFEGLNILLKV